MNQRGYLRQPTIAGDAIVFVCDDDLWAVGSTGGIARRLTAGLGEPSTPALSPDGAWLAFIGRDEQHPEVYLMPAQGGPARRMTWLGPDVMVRGWTPDGKILFVTTYAQPFFRNYRAWTLAAEGGLPRLLPYGQVNHLAFGANGVSVIGRNTADPARWKRYRGGTAGHLWIDADGEGEYRRMSELAGNVTSPMLIGTRVWFLSDAEGTGNLYSCRHDGSDVRRHTDHDDYYARNAATDGARIVYQCAGDIWLFDPRTDQSARIDVEVPAHRTQAARKFVRADEYLSGFNVHPAGHSVSVEARGKIFTFAHWEGAVRQRGEPDGVRYRQGQWLADGNRFVSISDESGEERVIVEGGATHAIEAIDWDIGRVLALRASPKGGKIAIANHRNEVLIGDVDSRKLVVVDTSDGGRTEDLAWSPDGAWLAYNFWTTPRHCAIKLHEVASGQGTLVTEPAFRDYSPSFDAEGKYLYFLSIRTFDPVYDAVQFELSFPRAARPYLIALQADQKPPFDPPPKGLQYEDKHGKAHHDGTATLRIDLEGIERRVAPFPVREDRFGQIAAVAHRRVLWTVLPIVGAHGRGGHSQAVGRLEIFDFDTMRAETLIEHIDNFVVSADHATLVVRDGHQLRALPAEKSDSIEHGNRHHECTRKAGWIDLQRIRLSVDPRAEWRQMLREVWRLQRDQFWVPDMSGIDWNAVYERYAPLLERIATRAELSDLIWEMQGELGTSHAYESGGDHRRPPQVQLGQLAADLEPAADGYAIAHIVTGDTWDPSADSPLNAIGVQAKAGERVVAVNGQPVTRERPPQALLVHQARNKVELTLADAEGARRDVVVATLADEAPARYREWVEKNRAFVHERSGGRVGYFHLPDMMSAGFAEFHRYFSAECDREALIVDVRYNRGGHVSQLLLEKVARRRVGYDLSRWMKPVPYPVESPVGPVVALANEHAGSDGDIFSHCFKLMDIGTLVGKRTWGGVIGIWPRHALVDGSETTQPEFSFWFMDVGFGVENYGTDPQIDVDNAPQDAVAKRDRQLEAAMAAALEALERATPVKPTLDARPRLAPPPLPRRRTEPQAEPRTARKKTRRKTGRK